jgi:hypothetical protein
MFDRALLEDDDFICAWNVVAGELDGGEYDWRSLDWKRRS